MKIIYHIFMFQLKKGPIIVINLSTEILMFHSCFICQRCDISMVIRVQFYKSCKDP